MVSFAVVQAAPVNVHKAEVIDATPEQVSALAKRQDLANALLELQELQELKAKRDDLAGELSEREYAIVTEVLTMIKDTDLAPVVLKFFVLNSTLKALTTTAIEFVIKSGLISLDQLFDLLVKSGLVTSVVSDLLGDCEVYVSIISLLESLLGSLFKRDTGNLFKREGGRTEPYTYEEGMELLRRDGLVPAASTATDFEAEKRDLDDVIVNVLESLASSGLATQVVEVILTDPDFIDFAVQLVSTLYANGEINIPGIVSAIVSSGMLTQLVEKFFNISTISEIVSTALEALEGKCSSDNNDDNNNGTDTGGGTGDDGNSTIGDIISAITGGSSSSSSASSSASSSLGLISSLLGGLLGLGSSNSGSSSSSGSSSGSSLISDLLNGLNITSNSDSSAAASSNSSSSLSLIGDLLAGLGGGSSGTTTDPTSTDTAVPASTDTSAASTGSDALSKILATLENSSSSSASSSSSSVISIAGSLLSSLLGGGSGDNSGNTSDPCASSGVTKRERLLLL